MGRIEELHQQFLSRDLSPQDALEDMIQQIERWEPWVNAWIRRDYDRARQEAEASSGRYRAGRPLGLLDGIPIGLKDLVETAGIPTTAGSEILKDYIPARDSTIVDRLRGQGAILSLGKLNMHEFAFGPTGTSSYFGPMRNPYDSGRMAGGSSGGSGVAVATGMVPVAIGSDTGGSIRIPAAFCGVAGLKPTYGRISRAGVIPLSWSLDHLGPLARTVEDLAIVTEALSGYDPLDPTSSPRAVPGLREALDRPWDGPMTLFYPDTPEWQAYDPKVTQAMEDAARVFERELGARIVRGSLPRRNEIVAMQQVIMGSEAAAFHWHWLEGESARYQPDVYDRLTTRSSYLAVQYIEALRQRNDVVAEYEAWFKDYDAVILPTVPVLPPALDETFVITPSGSREDVRATVTRFTGPFNLLGFPALSLPLALSQEGLPIGLQMVGRPFAEVRLLQLGYLFQSRTSFGEQRPALPKDA